MKGAKGGEGDIREDLASIHIRAEAICNPSEDMEKVKRALNNVVEGEIEVREIGEKRYLLSSEGKGFKGISKIYKGFKDRQVLMVVRKYLRSKMKDSKTTTLLLNKQAAYLGVIAIGEEGESSLGPIKVILSARDIRKIIEWMTKF
jgi:predicted RNA binding protein with dsRBD fold (UPF0201 family)